MTTKFEDFLPALIDKTRQGKIVWQSASTNLFSTEVGQLTVTVSNDGLTSTATLRNQDGDAIDSASGILIGTAKNRVLELYDAARRSALNIDASLVEFQKNLEKI